MLEKVTNNSTVNEIVEKVTGVNLSKGDIKGTWNYTGSAVKLESEDAKRISITCDFVKEMPKNPCNPNFLML